MRKWCILLVAVLLVACPCLAQDDVAEPAEPPAGDEPEDVEESQDVEEAEDPDSSGPEYGPYSPDSKDRLTAPSKNPIKLILINTYAGIGIESSQAAAALQVLRQSLTALERVEIIDEASLFAREEQAAPEEIDRDLKQAAKLVKLGKEHLLNLAMEESADAFLSARVTLRKHLQWLSDPEPLIMALMGLAETLAVGEREEEAKAAYREVLVLSPEYVPDPGQVPSKFRTLFDEARDQISNEASGSLIVKTKPAGANVVLDGLTIGQTPVSKENIPAGMHALLVQLDGHRTIRKPIEVLSGETTEIGENLVAKVIPDLIGKIRGTYLAESDQSTEALSRDLARITASQVVVLSQVVVNTKNKRVLTVAVVWAAEKKPCVLGVFIPEDNIYELGPVLAGEVSQALDQERKVAPPPTFLGLNFTNKLLGDTQPQATVSLVRKTKTKIDPKVPDPALPLKKKIKTNGESDSIFTTWWFWTGTAAIVVAAVGTSLGLTLGKESKTIQDPDVIFIQIERLVP